LGYLDGQRDIDKAKCKMKVCCIKRNYNSCSECPDLSTCMLINEFHGKNGYKYKKYRQAIEYVRANGYADFLKIADSWDGAYDNYT